MRLRNIRIILATLIAIMCLLGVATPVKAVTYYAPNITFAILQTEVYRNAIEPLDWLVLIPFTIGYSAGLQPSIPIDTAFLFRMTENTTIKMTGTTYGYANSGYGIGEGQLGLASMYFSPSDTPTWSGNMTMYFEGNPTLSWNGTTPSVNLSPFTLWYDGGTVANTQTRLQARILYLADQFQTDWGWTGTTPLLQTTVAGERLSSYGEIYFTNVIPNLRTICPALFYQSMSAAEFADDTLVEDYFVGSSSTAVQIHGVNWFAQTFLASDSYPIAGVQLPLYRVGNPGDINITLRAILAGVPTGLDLVSAVYDGNTLTTDTEGQWIAQAYTADYDLSSATTYAIVVSAPAGNAANYVGWLVNTDNDYANGQECSSVNSGGFWNAVPANDLLFELLVRGGAGFDVGHRYEVQLLGTVFDVSQIATNWGMDNMWTMTMFWLVISLVIIIAIAMATGAWNCWWIVLAIMTSYGWRAGFADTNLLIAILALTAIGIVWGIWFKRTY